MPRKIQCGLIQASMACPVTESIEAIRGANIEKTLRYVEQAGRQGVQVLCMKYEGQKKYELPVGLDHSLLRLGSRSVQGVISR